LLYYKRHIGDYIKDTSHLSLLEHGVYARLMDVYYTREVPLPDAEVLRLVSARGKEEIAAVKSVLAEFWDLTSEGWVQHRCDHEIEIARRKAETNQQNGSKGGRPRRGRTQTEPINNPVGLFTETQSVLCGIPNETLSNNPTNQLTNKPITPRIRSEENAHDDPNDFDAFSRVKAGFPAFEGGDSRWQLGQRNCQRLIEMGWAWAQLEDASSRFRAYIAAGGRSGPKYVDGPDRFFDPDNPKQLWRQEWRPPKNKAQVQQDANVAAGLAFLAEDSEP
jgi:uncharacterized protein YdaU (DUF1376 family)